jgi:hypothetical protein
MKNLATVIFMIAMILGLATAFYWLPDLIGRFVEAKPQQYEDIALVKRICPPLAQRASEALSDRRLTVQEATSLGRRMNDMTDDYLEAIEMRRAKNGLGIPSGAMPPACSNRRARTDYRIGNVLDPMWIRL